MFKKSPIWTEFREALVLFVYNFQQFNGPARLWSPSTCSAQLLLHLSPLLPAFLCFIPQGSFVWAKAFFFCHFRGGGRRWLHRSGWMEDEGPGRRDGCSAFSIIHLQLWVTLAKLHKSWRSERSVGFQMIKSRPGKSNSDVGLFCFYVSGDFVNGSLGFEAPLTRCKTKRMKEREREREGVMVLLLIPCALRLVRLNKLHEVSVSRTFHLCTWALECTNTTCFLRFSVCECLVGALCCVHRHSAGNQISVLSQVQPVFVLYSCQDLSSRPVWETKPQNQAYLCLYRCHIRVIDTFGTEPAYNHEEYATLHGYRTNWGYWNLNARQYMTMFRKKRMILLVWPL